MIDFSILVHRLAKRGADFDQNQFQKDMVAAHNKYRAAHCASPLVFKEYVRASAQAYANTLAQKNAGLVHSGGAYGENLATFSPKSGATCNDGETNLLTSLI